MRVAHLLLVHKNPHQVGRLVNLLAHVDADIYIHVDKKSEVEPFIPLSFRKNVYFIKNNVAVYWASYSQVQCIVNSLGEILRKDKDYAYINLISGQDLPVRPLGEFYELLKTGGRRLYMQCKSVDTDWRQAKVRLQRYDFPQWIFKGKHRMFELINLILPRKRYPLQHDIVGGSTWFTITPDAARYILDTFLSNKKLKRFFKYTWGADEVVFATVLFNSPYRKDIVDNLVYVDWGTLDDGHPRVLDMQDIDKIKQSGKFFARKFDEEISPEVVDHVTKMVSVKKES
ncbi:MAG: beta-1,6-N-acetylglucosaminyltransferase [Niabella sp.]